MKKLFAYIGIIGLTGYCAWGALYLAFHTM